MNILQIIMLSWSLYRRNAAWYALAGLLFAITMIMSTGMLSGAFLADCAVALAWGPKGAWIANVQAVAIIAAITSAGIAISFFIAFTAAGAFAHTCAQIGSGVREVNLIGFFEHMQIFAPTFFAIGFVQQALGAAVAMPIIALGIFASTLNPALLPVGIVLALIAWAVVQLPFWLAYPAQIVKQRGAVQSLQSSLRATISSPLATAFCILLLLALAIAPLALNIIYPIYFFFVYAPFCETLKLAYYEAVKGMLK